MIPWKQCGTACITKIVKERHEEPVIVYNLALKTGYHTLRGKQGFMYIMVMDMMVVKSLYANQLQRKMLYGIKENFKNIMKNIVFQNLEQEYQKNI